MKHRLLILMGVVGFGFSNLIGAQDFDDIYFDSSSSNSKDKKQVQQPVAENNVVEEYAGRSFSGENYIAERDVDEYNRRGEYYAQSDTASYAADSTYTDDDTFQYTERIKRFHNPSVVIESSDPDLVDLYVYTRPSVNIVVGTPTYSPLTVSTFLYTPSWGYYDPWPGYSYYHWAYDPFYLSFYDPFFYGYSWHYPYYYHHHHHAYWYPPVPHWGHGCVPSYGWHGNHIAHNPVRYSNGQGRRTAGSGISTGGRRPAGGTRIGDIVSNSSSTNGRRPASVSTSGSTAGRGGNVRVNSGSSNTRRSNSSNRGVYRRPSTSNTRSNATRTENTSTQRSYNNYNNNSYSGSRSSGSFSGGGRSSGSSGGSRGGGGHRR